MNESNLTLSTSQKLQTFLLLSKSVKGVANSKLILDTLAAPGIYVFSELAESPNVLEASQSPEVAPYYALLKIFMYGTYKDYVAEQANLPSLNDAQQTKLKHLSIVALSESSRTLPYPLLQEYLNISNVRALEDLIIDAFYQGIIVGKLDQRQQQLQVEYTMGRDVRPKQLEETMEALSVWSNNTKTVLDAIDNRIRAAHEMIAANQAEREDYDRHVERVRRQIRQKSSSSPNSGGSSNNNNNSSRMDTDESDSAGMLRTREQGAHDSNSEQRSGRAKKRGTKRFMVGHP
ncbi:hypothetical protein BDB00DRAFT_811008 [Zychaea mexicana]|uniref:uncharacterized protein n=1 Tax=Zychaea mexicana TaxID=64656 RepID=UPI0022FDDAE5|nr:uncharacterized protein BDB00DRAFT_811008 [Zychaea mexicana]KAI9495935.1 hypothetical protein BDB00DRAFT_811008 [Zychaea mexicana]